MQHSFHIIIFCFVSGENDAAWIHKARWQVYFQQTAIPLGTVSTIKPKAMQVRLVDSSQTGAKLSPRTRQCKPSTEKTSRWCYSFIMWMATDLTPPPLARTKSSSSLRAVFNTFDISCIIYAFRSALGNLTYTRHVQCVCGFCMIFLHIMWT